MCLNTTNNTRTMSLASLSAPASISSLTQSVRQLSAAHISAVARLCKTDSHRRYPKHEHIMKNKRCSEMMCREKEDPENERKSRFISERKLNELTEVDGGIVTYITGRSTEKQYSKTIDKSKAHDQQRTWFLAFLSARASSSSRTQSA